MSRETWTIKRILDWTREYLERKGDEHPRLSAEWLLSAATGLSRVELYTSFDKPLAQDELDAMHTAIERRAAGEPLQYVTGEMPFRHIVLRCEKGVLIPRPETEVLVDAVLSALGPATVEAVGEGIGDKTPCSNSPRASRCGTRDESYHRPPDLEPAPELEPDSDAGELEADRESAEPVFDRRVLEIGTGTGCIALSIASERPGTRVVATDISPTAVALAQRNCEALGLEDAVSILECDLAEGVDEELRGTFDAFVSNPPYIPTEVLARDIPQEVVGFEPALALDGGADGLDVFRRILAQAPTLLKPGGILAVELFEESLGQAAELARESGGWARTEIIRDLTGRERILLAEREA